MSEKKHYHRGRRRSSTLSGSRGNSGHDRDRAKRKAKRQPEDDWDNDWIDLEEADDLGGAGEDDWETFQEDDDLRTPDQVKSTGRRRDSAGRSASGGKKGKSKKAKGSRKGRIVSNIVLAVAILVFCVSAFQLFRILSGYYEGRKEYDEVKELAITEEESEDGDTRFTVDFDTLLGINPDTVGWIRFDPEPSQINYPLVQTTDNSTYLNKTFSANDNTVGAIFVNAYNSPDFNDRNTIIYGHRMNDSSMFHDLAKYEDQSFWEANPYFYIYTPDGREITYHIYAAGQVTETSDTYLTEFADDAAYQAFLDYTKEASAYDTGVEVTTSDTVVTLSTCTKASDEHRMVVVGVKESEEQIN